jgi:hypothetical protein
MSYACNPDFDASQQLLHGVSSDKNAALEMSLEP